MKRMTMTLATVASATLATAPPPPPCTKWATLHQSQPYCDAPDSGSTWAVNLDKVLGPHCSAAAAENLCCYVPLGYDSGPAFGTPCQQVCGTRASAADAYCQKSDGSDFGNCFCGPISRNSRLGVRGINYGGRFIPEHWMNLTGMKTLYGNVTPGGDCKPHACALSTCDMAATKGAGSRMLSYLDAIIREDDFVAMAGQGFNFVRLPLGYWQLVQATAAPDAPEPTASRFKALQDMAAPADYAPFIQRVINYAAKHGLQLLFDLHGAPGGQSTNQCTGCATGCEGFGCADDLFYLMRDANQAVAIEAVTQLAKWCMRANSTCYGIELLNEPSLEHLDRMDLLAFYQKAVKAARGPGGLSPTIPIVVMDYVTALDNFWSTYHSSIGALMGKAGAGTIHFETHIYVAATYDSIALLEVQALPMLALLRRFVAAAGANYTTFIGEYGLGRAGDTISLEDVVRWWYGQAAADENSLGLAIWNYDGPGHWGGLKPNDAPQRTWWKAVNQWPFAYSV